MRYRIFTLLAVLVFAGSLYLFCTKLTELLDTGTCASGNTPYEISRPCPEGTDTDAYLLMASIFGLFAAVGLAGLRGPRPGGGGFGFGAMMLTGWALFFTIGGGVSLYHSLTSDVIGEDGKLGGIIVGATFLFMGVPSSSSSRSCSSTRAGRRTEPRAPRPSSQAPRPGERAGCRPSAAARS